MSFNVNPDRIFDSNSVDYDQMATLGKRSRDEKTDELAQEVIQHQKIPLNISIRHSYRNLPNDFTIPYETSSVSLPESNKEALIRQLKEKSKDQNIIMEFINIGPTGNNIHYTREIASDETNALKNRYSDIVPFDANMYAVGPEGRYLNASFIEFDNKSSYIATQAPKMNTIDDFWRAVFDSNTDTIVMLTNLMEGKIKKADPYWPEVGGTENLDNNQLKLTLNSQENCGPFEKRNFTITDGETTKNITHFQFTKWPDKKVAEVNEFKSLLEAVEGTHQSGPLVVHCSAGVGRAGTFIATHSLRKDLRNSIEPNVMQRVTDLRGQRMHSVQTMDQYKLIYETLKQS